MSKKVTGLATSLAFALLIILGGLGPPVTLAQSPGGAVEAIARAACEGVCIVSQVSQGTRGAPILVLEEQHGSRAGQIQQAIALVRLHDRHRLRHIVLEGYLQEHPELKTEWFTSAARRLPQTARTGVAVRLLREGEVSSAEFGKLVYEDLLLHPGETRAEYAVELLADAESATLLYLLKIAALSLPSERAAQARQLQEDMEKLGGEAKQKKRDEWYDAILAGDAWAQAKAKVWQDINARRVMSDEQHLALVEEIARRAQERSVTLLPHERNAMERNLAFWRGRAAASATLMRSASAIADRQGVALVAMIVGAAHTEGITRRLTAAERPFAVLTPASLKKGDDRGDLTWGMLERKRQRISVYAEGWTELLLQAFPPPQQKKPEPVLSEPWLQAKAELYLFVTDLARSVLGPPSPPGGGRPPFGFADDAFRGTWLAVDPRRLAIVADDEERGRGRTMVFPVILHPEDARRRTEIWVKAGRWVAPVAAEERASAESMLRKALDEVQAERETREKADDDASRVQIDLDTVAAFGNSQEAVRKVVLGAS